MTWRIEHGDCLDVIEKMDGVDAIITDPPYGVNLQYGAAFDDTPDIWLGMVPKILQWADERQILIICFGASPTQARDLMAFHRLPDRTLIWNPAFSLSKSRANGIFYRWHPIYCWNLPKKHDGPSLDVLRYNCDGHNWWNHPGTKPVTLMASLVNIASPGATILDPFCGSGTTGVACIQTGRNFIGIEIDEKYIKIAKQRCVAAEMQLRLI